MFSWKSEVDRKIIQEGLHLCRDEQFSVTIVCCLSGPFELRVLKKPLDQPYLSLPAPWCEFLCKHRGIDPKSLKPAAANSNNAATNDKKKTDSKCVVC